MGSHRADPAPLTRRERAAGPFWAGFTFGVLCAAGALLIGIFVTAVVLA